MNNNKNLNYNRESHLRWYKKSGKEYYKNYYEENKEKIRQYQLKYYEKNKQEIRRRQRKYYYTYINDENYYKQNINYFKKYYESKRQKLLDLQAHKKAYGNCNVKFNSDKKYIISFN